MDPIGPDLIPAGAMALTSFVGEAVARKSSISATLTRGLKHLEASFEGEIAIELKWLVHQSQQIKKA